MSRRAAKLVKVDIDHPDIEAYMDWKVVEEQKVAALVAGSKLANQHMNAVMRACHDEARGGHGLPLSGADRFAPKVNATLKRAIKAARKVMIPENYVHRVITFAHTGSTELAVRTYDTDRDPEPHLQDSGKK